MQQTLYYLTCLCRENLKIIDLCSLHETFKNYFYVAAHGKRSYTPQRDLQNDRWALFKLPEKVMLMS